MELLRRQIGNAIDANPTNATNTQLWACSCATSSTNRPMGWAAISSVPRGGAMPSSTRTTPSSRTCEVPKGDVLIVRWRSKRLPAHDPQRHPGRRASPHCSAQDEEGMQAWRESGATFRHIIDESTSGVATDARATRSPAAKMHRVIQQLDQRSGADSKFSNFVLARRAPSKCDMNEIVKAIYTARVGAVNTSNTASVILAAIAEAERHGRHSGPPVPAVSTFKLLTRYARDRQTRQRILQALGEAEQNVKKQPSAPPGATVCTEGQPMIATDFPTASASTWTANR